MFIIKSGIYQKPRLRGKSKVSYIIKYEELPSEEVGV